MKLDTDFSSALARLRSPSERKTKVFPIPTLIFSKQRAKDALKKRDRSKRKSFIKPENCREIIAAMPMQEGDSLHAITPGDFVFCDLIRQIAEGNRCRARISTLSMSVKNAETLSKLLETGEFSDLDLILSHYFHATSKEIFAAIKNRLSSDKRCRVTVCRSHCKIALLQIGTRRLVIEGSANLRSSDSFEQISIFCDRALHDFHAQWFEKIFGLDE